MRRVIPTLLRTLLLCLLALPLALSPARVWAAPPLAIVTIVQGEPALLRETGSFVLTEGVRVRPGDIVELGNGSPLLRLEFADGTSLMLGPGSRLLLSPRLPERPKARAYLLTGWAKLSVPTGAEFWLATPVADLSGSGARAAVGVRGGERAQFFAEGGDWQIRQGGSPLPLPAGGFATLSPKARPESAPRPSPEFIQSLPRAFMDTLPARAQLFADRDPPPKAVGTIAYPEAQAWLNAEASLRRAELPRWRPLAKEAEFRKGLVAELKLHPEWEPILFPPPPTPTSAAASKP